MTLAYDYPLLGIFWSMLVFFLFVAFWLAIFYIVIDIFRSKDLSGIAKAGWLLFVFFFPVIGVLVYLIARGDRIAERALDTGQARDPRYARYYQGAI
jgi:hypothetical protein